MTNTNKNIKRGAMALALAAAVSVFPSVSALAAGTNTVDPMADRQYVTVASPVETTMADYVKGLTMLTASEKQQLVYESVAAQPYYDRISGLNAQIDDITNDVLKGAESLFTERGRLFDAHKALWDKLWDNMNETQKGLSDHIAIINASTVLNNGEKAVLVKAQTRINTLEAGIDAYYAKAAEATKELSAQRDQAIAELQDLYAKSSHIWAKVYGE